MVAEFGGETGCPSGRTERSDNSHPSSSRRLQRRASRRPLSFSPAATTSFQEDPQSAVTKTSAQANQRPCGTNPPGASPYSASTSSNAFRSLAATSAEPRRKVWGWKLDQRGLFCRSFINSPRPLADGLWRPRKRRPFSSNLRFFCCWPPGAIFSFDDSISPRLSGRFRWAWSWAPASRETQPWVPTDLSSIPPSSCHYRAPGWVFSSSLSGWSLTLAPGKPPGTFPSPFAEEWLRPSAALGQY